MPTGSTGQTVLVIDDERNLRLSIRQGLELDGFTVQDAECIKDAWELTRKTDFDAIVTDVNLVGESGIDLVKRLRADSYEGVIIVITAYGTIDSAVDAIKHGADEYLQKPVSLDELSVLLGKALEHRAVRRRLGLYERLERVRGEGGDEALGDSEPWKKTLTLAARYASIPLPKPGSTGELPTILVLGETGAGKGVIANLIHRNDPTFNAAKPAPFVHVNCAALPVNLIEGELFGHEKGAYTDARDARAGLFEMADGGTIFLDEIGEVPLEVQAKLLTVLEKGVFRRLGGTKERTARARIIAATNQDLEDRVRQNTFRKDLLYRLNSFVIRIPPLRDRGNDALVIARRVLARLSESFGRGRLAFSPAAEAALRAHDWPGNVRELCNVVRRAALMCDTGTIEPDDLGLTTQRPHDFESERAAGVGSVSFAAIAAENGRAGLPTVEDMERALIIEALRLAHGNVSRAATLIGLNRGALRYRIERLGIDSHIAAEASQA